MKIPKYIGGDFSNNDLDDYQQISSDLDFYFPEVVNGKYRNYFETGTDSLAAIITENFCVKSKVNLFIPENYCFETIERLKLKLLGFEIKLNLKNYSTIEEIEFSENTCLIINHFNKYKQLQNDFKFQEIVIIEDFVQAPLDISKFQTGFAINSLRKFCNLELSVSYLKSTFNSEQFYSDYYILRRAAKLLKADYMNSQDKNIEELYLNLFKISNQKLFTKYIYVAQSEDICTLGKLDFNKIITKRIENYNYLKSELHIIDEIEILEGEYMYFIIKCKKRDLLKKHLFTKNIFTSIHWLDSFSKLSNEILTFHIDQRYTLSDMERVSSEIKSFYESKN